MADGIDRYLEGTVLSPSFVLTGTLSTDQNGLVGELSGELSTLTGTLDGEKLRGYSAYDVACEEGFIGSKSDWLKSLRGERGIEGPRGNGVARAWLNVNGTLSIQYTNGDTYTTDRSIVPLKGVDYFTKADVDAIVEEVIRRLQP